MRLYQGLNPAAGAESSVETDRMSPQMQGYWRVLSQYEGAGWRVWILGARARLRSTPIGSIRLSPGTIGNWHYKPGTGIRPFGGYRTSIHPHQPTSVLANPSHKGETALCYQKATPKQPGPRWVARPHSTPLGTPHTGQKKLLCLAEQMSIDLPPQSQPQGLCKVCMPESDLLVALFV